jgi:hypothetical protein
MVVDVSKIFERLLKIREFKTLKELSVNYGYQKNWASNCRLKGTIPWDVCLKISIEYKLSIDYLVFGINENSNKVDINELKLSVTEGVFAAIQADMIVLNKDVKISHVTETITSEIKEACNINDESQQLNKAQ